MTEDHPFAAYDPEGARAALPGLIIRAAAFSDTPYIALIDAQENEALAKTYEPLIHGELERIASGELARYTAVAEAEGQVVGYSRCGLIEGAENLPDGWYLNGLKVKKAFRRRGIGEAMTTHRLDWLRERTQLVYYFTAEINPVSMDLHHKFGFEELERNVVVPFDRVKFPQRLFRLRFTGGSAREDGNRV